VLSGDNVGCGCVDLPGLAAAREWRRERRQGRGSGERRGRGRVESWHWQALQALRSQ